MQPDRVRSHIAAYRASADQLLADLRTTRTQLETASLCHDCRHHVTKAINDLGPLVDQATIHVQDMRNLQKEHNTATGPGSSHHAPTPEDAGSGPFENVSGTAPVSPLPAERPSLVPQVTPCSCGVVSGASGGRSRGPEPVDEASVAVGAREGAKSGVRPPIVCLCGSTRFYDAFQQANYDLTMAGWIVLSVGFYPHAKAEHGHGEGVGHDSAEKITLDELHKRKIDLADEVLILNVGGYIGSSTRSELEYARKLGKRVRFLEPEEVRADG